MTDIKNGSLYLCQTNMRDGAPNAEYLHDWTGLFKAGDLLENGECKMLPHDEALKAAFEVVGVEFILSGDLIFG